MSDLKSSLENAADSVRDAIQAWDENHDYDNKPPGSIGVPLARAPAQRRATKWRINIYGRS